MIVLDASAALDLLLMREPLAQQLDDELRRTAGIHVPHLWFIEVAQVLRRHVQHGALGPARAQAALDVARDLPTQRYAHEPLARRIWQLRDNATAYDATYLALAEGLRAPLLTTDRKLANTPGHQATIQLVEQP